MKLFRLFGVADRLSGNLWRHDPKDIVGVRPLLKMRCGDLTSCEIVDVCDGIKLGTKMLVLYPFLQKEFTEYYGMDFLSLFPVGESFDLECALKRIAVFKVLGYEKCAC